MKMHVIAACLAASAPVLAACATTGAETAGSTAAYEAAQAEVARLALIHSLNVSLI